MVWSFKMVWLEMEQGQISYVENEKFSCSFRN